MRVLASIGHQPPDLASYFSGHLVLGAVGSMRALNGGWGMNMPGEEYWPSFTNSCISRLKTHLFICSWFLSLGCTGRHLSLDTAGFQMSDNFLNRK